MEGGRGQRRSSGTAVDSWTARSFSRRAPFGSDWEPRTSSGTPEPLPARSLKDSAPKMDADPTYRSYYQAPAFSPMLWYLTLSVPRMCLSPVLNHSPSLDAQPTTSNSSTRTSQPLSSPTSSPSQWRRQEASVKTPRSSSINSVSHARTISLYLPITPSPTPYTPLSPSLSRGAMPWLSKRATLGQ